MPQELVLMTVFTRHHLVYWPSCHHAMTDDGAGAPPPAASYRKLKTPGTSSPVLVVIFWCIFPEKLELRAGDKFMTHLFIDL